jgi:hypothetical protein
LIVINNVDGELKEEEWRMPKEERQGHNTSQLIQT